MHAQTHAAKAGLPTCDDSHKHRPSVFGLESALSLLGCRVPQGFVVGRRVPQGIVCDGLSAQMPTPSFSPRRLKKQLASPLAPTHAAGCTSLTRAAIARLRGEGAWALAAPRPLGRAPARAPPGAARSRAMAAR
eukprot:11813971-Alexandrium_andersonii.AAC.1